VILILYLSWMGLAVIALSSMMFLLKWQSLSETVEGSFFH
jgi:hypothetical protein